RAGHSGAAEGRRNCGRIGYLTQGRDNLPSPAPPNQHRIELQGEGGWKVAALDQRARSRACDIPQERIEAPVAKWQAGKRLLEARAQCLGVRQRCLPHSLSTLAWQYLAWQIVTAKLPVSDKCA